MAFFVTINPSFLVSESNWFLVSEHATATLPTRPSGTRTSPVPFKSISRLHESLLILKRTFRYEIECGDKKNFFTISR